MLYQIYHNLCQKGFIKTGFSSRLPDYANKYWLEQLEKAVGKTAKRSFLDVGAGDGRLSVLLAQAGFEKGTAVEIGIDKEVWEGHLKRFPNLSLYPGLLQDILPKLPAKGYDFILMAEVFEHIPPADIDAILKSLYRLLADKGLIFLTTPNKLVQGPAEQSSLWHEKVPYGHHRHYTPNELREIFTWCGFTQESIAFECHRLKKRVYNDFFYPAARLDQKFLSTSKLPNSVRASYRVISTPLISAARGIFWLLAQAIGSFEASYDNQGNAETQIMTFCKSNCTM